MIEAATDRLSQWVELCLCHDKLRKGLSKQQVRQLFRKHYKNRWSSCPCTGRRISELTADGLDRVIAELWNDMEQKVFNGMAKRHPHMLTPDVIASVTASVQYVRVHVNGHLQEKLNYLKQLPWVMAAFGHWDDYIFTKFAAKVLDMFAIDPRKDVHHRVTWRLLRPGSWFRAELEACARREKSRWECSNAFLVELGKLKFMPLHETPVEATHAKVSIRKGKRKLGQVKVSLSNRLALFRNLVARYGKAFVNEFFSIFDQVRNPKGAAALLVFGDSS